MKIDNIIISVIGLGYVGLPVAVAFSNLDYKVYGFDLNKNRISLVIGFGGYTSVPTIIAAKKLKITKVNH